MKNWFFVALLLFTPLAQAQWGCTDPQATNYDPAATKNNGSCLYQNTLISPKILLQKLSDTLNETSGLARIRNQWYSHNDGGNPAAIYRLGNNGSIAQTIVPRNQNNIDWEDLTASNDHAFIGDFGNNNGDRKDLKILKLPINAWMGSALVDSIDAETIAFSFADQTQFTPSAKTTPFDCEAMIFWGDSLHIFTKSWSNGITKRYVIPAVPGNYSVSPRDSLSLGFLVTGAAVYQGRLALVGYDKSGNGFLELLWDFPSAQPFNGNKRKIALGSFVSVGQIESVAFQDSITLVATNEKYVVANRLMEIPLATVWGKTAFNKQPKHAIDLTVSPNPNSGQILVRWQQANPRTVEMRIFPVRNPNSSLICKKFHGDAGPNEVNIDLDQRFAAGAYILQITGIEKGLRMQETLIYQPQ